MVYLPTLLLRLNSSTKTNDKLAALVNYFARATDKDKVWVIAIFSGRRPRRAVNSTQLSTWCTELADVPHGYLRKVIIRLAILAETIALLLPEATASRQDVIHSVYYIEKFIEIEKQDEEIKKQFHSQQLEHNDTE